MKLASGANYILVNEEWLQSLMAEAEKAQKDLDASQAIGELDKALAGCIFAPLRGHIASAKSVIEYSPIFERIGKQQASLGMLDEVPATEA